MAFYQKYRPRTLKELVGQDFVRTTLQSALKRDQAAHAYLFFGSRGTGKTSTARILAKALNCQNPQSSGDPCNECDFCRAADAGNFVDLIEIDGASNRKIEHARALIEKINFAPTLGKRKVYIIDEVHMLTREAFNALLKTIEEPPEHAYFLLATTELQKVPETIRSRCQTFTFHRFTPEQIAERLAEIASKENIKASKDALILIAKKAVGGLRDAIGLFEQSAAAGEVSVEYLQRELGLASEGQLSDFYTLLESGNAAGAIDHIGRISSEGLSLGDFMEQFLGLLREKMLLYSIGNEQDRQKLAFAMRVIEVFEEARRQLRDAPIPTLPIEVAIIRTIFDSPQAGPVHSAPSPAPSSPAPPKPVPGKKPEEGASPKEPPKTPSQAESKAPSPQSKAVADTSAPDAPPAIDSVLQLTPENVRANRQKIMEKLSDNVLKAALMQAQFEVVGSDSLHLLFASETFRNQAIANDRFGKLQSAIHELFGSEVRIDTEVKTVILEPVGAAPAPEIDESEPVTDPAVIGQLLNARQASGPQSP